MFAKMFVQAIFIMEADTCCWAWNPSAQGIVWKLLSVIEDTELLVGHSYYAFAQLHYVYSKNRQLDPSSLLSCNGCSVRHAV